MRSEQSFHIVVVAPDQKSLITEVTKIAKGSDIHQPRWTERRTITHGCLVIDHTAKSTRGECVMQQVFERATKNVSVVFALLGSEFAPRCVLRQMSRVSSHSTSPPPCLIALHFPTPGLFPRSCQRAPAFLSCWLQR